MGMLDTLSDLVSGQKQNAKGVAFSLSTSFTPFRLSSKKNDTADLILEIENVSGAGLLASISVQVPRGLGLDATMTQKEKNYKAGEMKEGETKKARVQIYSAMSTKPGVYPIAVEVFSHYRDYTHIITSVKKTVELRVV